MADELQQTSDERLLQYARVTWGDTARKRNLVIVDADAAKRWIYVQRIGVTATRPCIISTRELEAIHNVDWIFELANRKLQVG